MKEFDLKSTNEITAANIEKNGAKFSVKQLTDANVLGKCSASIVEIPPKSFAYGYHYHEAVEEIFYVLSGSGVVKTIKGEINVVAGDVISFPTGPGGSHVMTNNSDSEVLTYLDFGTRSEIDIAHLPEINKIMVMSMETTKIIDKE